MAALVKKYIKLVTTYGEDTNKNGVQELGEKGVGNGTVTVFDNNTNTKVGEAVTKEDGSYLIPNLPNGDYRVEFSIYHKVTK